MTLTSAEIITHFDSEAGAVSALASTAQKLLWWNEGALRLLKNRPLSTDVTWAAADRSVALPTGFITMDKVVTDEGFVPQPWRVFGNNLVIDTSDGASAAGEARVYYWGQWTLLTDGGTSAMLAQEDLACINYALSRFYRRLSSNRAYYKRYATMVGANAVTQSDLQQEAQSYYQDYLDSREDVQELPPAFFYESE